MMDLFLIWLVVILMQENSKNSSPGQGYVRPMIVDLPGMLTGVDPNSLVE